MRGSRRSQRVALPPRADLDRTARSGILGQTPSRLLSGANSRCSVSRATPAAQHAGEVCSHTGCASAPSSGQQRRSGHTDCFLPLCNREREVCGGFEEPHTREPLAATPMLHAATTRRRACPADPGQIGRCGRRHTDGGCDEPNAGIAALRYWTRTTALQASSLPAARISLSSTASSLCSPHLESDYDARWRRSVTALGCCSRLRRPWHLTRSRRGSDRFRGEEEARAAPVGAFRARVGRPWPRWRQEARHRDRHGQGATGDGEGAPSIVGGVPRCDTRHRSRHGAIEHASTHGADERAGHAARPLRFAVIAVLRRTEGPP